MSKALAYASGFISSCIATAILATPMPYVIQNKAELGQVLEQYAINKQALELNSRSYNNSALMGLTGLMAIGSFGFLVKELSDKPLIEMPQTIPSQSPITPPVIINNSNHNNVRNVAVNRSERQKREYTPDLVDELPSDGDPFAWLKQIYGSNCLLFFGGQGSGKTSFVEWYANEKTNQGNEVIVFDVHRKFGAWKGLKVVGDGRNYQAIDDEILQLEKRITVRYQQFATVEDFNPRPITLIFEEFSKWKSFCKHSDGFFLTALTDVRKVFVQVVFVAHMKTMSGLTNQKGLAETFKNGVDQLELISEKIECTDGIQRARPTGKGKLTLVNSPKSVLVSIPSYDPIKAVESPNYNHPNIINLNDRRQA
jgi:hypothetical protein